MEKTGALNDDDPITRRRLPVPESTRVAPDPDLPCIMITAAYRPSGRRYHRVVAVMLGHPNAGRRRTTYERKHYCSAFCT